MRLASEYLRATSYIMQNLKRITLPFVTFHSDGDTMTDPDGSRALYDQASSEIKEYENCPGSWHILITSQGTRALSRRPFPSSTGSTSERGAYILFYRLQTFL